MDLFYIDSDDAEESSESDADLNSSDNDSDYVRYDPPLSPVTRKGKDMDLNDSVIWALRCLREGNETDELPGRHGRDDAKNGNLDVDFFCAEDTILSKNVKVTVDGIGELAFPLDEATIRRLIKISKKAKFGRGEKTIMDVKVRDTQMIPASKLNVQIEEGSIDNAAAQLAKALHVHKNSSLVPQLYNMLIYGPGQFFSKHRDSEKVDNMVATMVVLLPFEHKGGELIIEHQNKKHIFFGSPIPEIMKCVAFYADCNHEVKKVESGYRVALTYNLQLKCEDLPESLPLDDVVQHKVNAYFEKKDKLMFYLNHSYSEHSLKWNMLKSVDWKYANALLAVAEHENYTAYLALAEYHETRDLETYRKNITESETSLAFLVDRNNKNSVPSKHEDRIFIDDSEICYTIETKELLEPYETEEEGPTGNEGNTGDYWYRRACIVLWPSHWVFSKGFNEELQKLHDLTNQEGMQKELSQKIEDASRYFFNTKFWNGHNTKKLLEIAVYLNNYVSMQIFAEISPVVVLDLENLAVIACVKSLFDSESWPNIFEQWRRKQSDRYEFEVKALKSILKFISSNLTYTHALVLLNEASNIFIAPKTFSYPSLYTTSDYVTSLCQILQIAENLNAKNVASNAVRKLESDLKEHTRMIYSTSDVTLLKNVLSPKHFEQLYDFFLLTFSVACLKSRKVTKISSILTLLVSSDFKFVEKLVSAIKSHPKIYSANFLGELFFSLEKNLTPVQLSLHQSLLHSILVCINSDFDNWSIPLKLKCDCLHCKQVQSLLTSRTSLSTFIDGIDECDITHVERVLRKIWPLYTQTEKVGNRLRLIIKKCSSWIADRKQQMEKLKDCKRKIIQLINAQVKNSTHSPSSKILKIA